MEAAKAVCGKEALNVLNCVVESNYDQDKCLHLLQSLRQCVLSKKVKKFSLPEEKPLELDSGSKRQA
ncbi:hypothetical protein BVRB_5g099410 [Beta vulgaris subsp. vulgaris]|nr:hypothetical protein BVRB_5g099410 [Beta vulgaris subsp. vulgaris]